MKARTKKFTIDCAILCSKLPHSREFNAYVNQQITELHNVQNQLLTLLIN